MTINGDILEIELNMEISEVIELKNFVATRLEYIEAIEVADADVFQSSSLLQLLYSIKKTKPSIAINVIDNDLKLKTYGAMYWTNHD
jgi:hypothetical protein